MRRRAWKRRPAGARGGAAGAIALLAVVLGARGAARAADAPQGAAPEAMEVTVRGDLLPRSAADATAATSVIDGDELRVPGQSAADTLSRAPGVQVARSGAPGELATASLRGSTTAQTPIYLAGVRLNDDVTGTADLSTVPTFALRRVEVWRGASPMWVDRPGLAGAILLEPELPTRSRAGAAVGVGSLGRRFAWVGGSVGDRDAAAALSLRGDAATNDFDYVDDGGTRFDASDDVTRARDNADLRAGDAWVLGRFALGERARVGLVLNGFLREQGVTGLAVIPAQASRATTRRELLAITTEARCGARVEDECAVELVTHGLRTSYELSDPLRELGFGTDRQVTRGARVAQDVRVLARLADPVAVDAGAGVASQRILVSPRGLPDVRARRATLRGHAEIAVTPIEPLEVRAGASLTHDETRGAEGPAPALTAPSARIASRLVALPWLTLLASGTRNVRVPTLGEVFGASAVLRGNPALREERALGVEGGARAEGEAARGEARASVEAIAFARFAEDLVAYRRTSIGGVRPFNVSEARVVGGELDGAVELFRHVRASLALTLLDPRDRSAPDAQRDLLPHVARLVAAPELEVFARRPFDDVPLERASLAARLVYRGERVADPAGLIVLPAQGWLDVEAVVALAEDRLAVRANVANVLDDDATDTLGLPLPGRSVFVAAEAWWN